MADQKFRDATHTARVKCFLHYKHDANIWILIGLLVHRPESCCPQTKRQRQVRQDIGQCKAINCFIAWLHCRRTYFGRRKNKRSLTHLAATVGASANLKLQRYVRRCLYAEIRGDRCNPSMKDLILSVRIISGNSPLKQNIFLGWRDTL